ncbi:MAG TPA: TetR/AcrR family transcriptional regulator [Saprospiraceae bacterium]|nr:TetR/AcrR family transcriptional regulator [Saprospiraceae bacterium]
MATTGTRKEEIQIAAAKLFGEKGFSACSVRDIAQAVGLGAASLYNHMDSKDELLTTICFRCAHEFLDGMKAIDESPISPEEKIKALIRLQIHIALNDKSSVTVFNDEWRHLQEPFLSEFLILRRLYEKTYLRILREGIENKIFRPTDEFIIYQMILSSLRWLHMPNIKKTKLTPEELTEQITLILIKGIVV